MEGPSLQENRRKDFRCPVLDERWVKLRLGDLRISARLCDESMGGFGLIAEGIDEIPVGRVGQLETAAGRFEVRVLHASCPRVPSTNEYHAKVDDGELVEEEPHQQEEPVEEEDPSICNRCASVWRIGLERRREVIVQERSWRLLVGRLRYLLPGGWLALIVFGSVLGAGTVFAALQLVSVRLPTKSADDRSATAKTHPRWRSLGDVVSGEQPDKKDIHLPKIPWNEAIEFALKGPDEALSLEAGQSFDPRAELLKKVRLVGAAPFTAPEVVRILKLTESQQKAMRGIVEASSQSIRDVESRLRGRSRGEIDGQRDLILDHACREAVKLLTGEQQQRWKELVDESAAAGLPAAYPPAGL